MLDGVIAAALWVMGITREYIRANHSRSPGPTVADTEFPTHETTHVGAECIAMNIACMAMCG